MHTALARLAGVLQFVSMLDEMGIAVDPEDPTRDTEGRGMIFLKPPQGLCCSAGHLPLPLRVTV